MEFDILDIANCIKFIIFLYIYASFIITSNNYLLLNLYLIKQIYSTGRVELQYARRVRVS
jgi:hypothetical protein